MHSLLIYNPVSGRKDGKKERLGRIIENLTASGKEVTVCQTIGRGDAKNCVLRHSAEDYDRVICCGGDGTLHEVINGLLECDRKIPIGYIPMGSTNDYAKNLGITAKTALECIENGVISNIDIGCLNGEYFNYVAAFGMLTGVSIHTPQEMKNTFGYFAYMLEGIKQLTDVSSKKVRFCTENGEWQESDILIGMVTNTFSVAGIKNFNRSRIQLDDGVMEYLFIKRPKNWLELQTIITSLLNEKIDERYMHYGQFHTMQMETEPMEWTLDGENGGIHEYVKLEIHPGAVSLIHKKE
ncbi:MAG: diacylglycerol kinase family lipid kinase [Lachnospiraceae bacterium]|nr:diacylglycerol kinase family lipid kinase [Lachnospiraceae bacterium]